MKVVIALSIIPLVIMLPTFSPFSFNHAQGQMSFPCPNGYQHDSLGVCVPIGSPNPILQECPDSYIKSSSGICELVGPSSLLLNNTTNQTLNQGSSLAPDGAAPLQQTQPLQMQPEQNQTLSQSYPAPPSQQQQWSTYQDPSGTFTISYPASWISDQSESGTIMFTAPAETFSDRYDINAGVSVYSSSLPSMSNTLQAFTEYKLRTPFPGSTIIQSQETTLAGLPAHMVVKETSIPLIDIGMGSKVIMLEVWTVKGDKSYSILYNTPVDKFEQYLPVAQQMINSFKILN